MRWRVGAFYDSGGEGLWQCVALHDGRGCFYVKGVKEPMSIRGLVVFMNEALGYAIYGQPHEPRFDHLKPVDDTPAWTE